MTICNLRKLPHSGTWMWRTVEGNTGDYYTFGNGQGIHFFTDDHMHHWKLCTMERFSVCKTTVETEQKLNRIFSQLDHDPIPGLEDELKLDIPMEKR